MGKRPEAGTPKARVVKLNCDFSQSQLDINCEKL